MQYQVLQTFSNYIEANVLLWRFKEAGINCLLKAETTVTTDPILANATGRVKLMVAIDELKKATTIMNEFEQQQRENYLCPNCGSFHIEYINKPQKATNWFGAIVRLLRSSYAVSFNKIWHCFICEKEFKKPIELLPGKSSDPN